ncbi:MAG: HD domain-containing protein [Actinobacteria bacterium]|nr:HD domain-containing protein [Actinomycetota bacterium]
MYDRNFLPAIKKEFKEGFPRAKIRTKITVPFIVFNIATALLAGYVATNWVARRIEETATVHIKDASKYVDIVLGRENNQMKLNAEVLAEKPTLWSGVDKKDKNLLGAELLSSRSVFDLDFIEVIDSSQNVLLNIDGPFAEKSNLSNLLAIKNEAVKTDVTETPKGVAFLSAAPIRSPYGISGSILVGRYMNKNFLAKIKGETKKELVFYLNGKLVESTFAKKYGDLTKKLGISFEINRKILKENKTLIQDKTIDHLPYKIQYFPFKVNPDNTVVFAVMRPTSDVLSAKTVSITRIILADLLVVITTLFIGYFVSRAVAIPTRYLRDITRKIADGDLEHHINVESDDEIGELAASINQMTDSLKAQTDNLQRRITELSALYDFSKSINVVVDANQLFNVILDNAIKVCRADLGYLSMIEENGGMSVKAFHGFADTGADRTNIQTGKGIASLAVREGKPLLFTSEMAELKQLIGGIDINSAICAPLRLKNETIGVLTIATTNSETVFKEDTVKLLTMLANEAATAIQNAKLFEVLEHTYLSTVKALAAAVDAKDPYTHGHSEKVSKYAVMIAKSFNLSEFEAQGIEIAGYLHDIGKIGISDEILLKPGRLNREERDIIRQHSLVGANILAPIGFPWEIIPIVRHHHERFNGLGYPAGLGGKRIPLGARILAIADAFEAITTDRPYRKARTMVEAIDELKKHSGTQFDPLLVEAFIKVLKEKESELIPVSRSFVRIAVEEEDERLKVKAIFVAITESLLKEYSKLGGVQLTLNLEKELNGYFLREGWPIRIEDGHIDIDDFKDKTLDEEVLVLKRALSKVMRMLNQVAGDRILRHFCNYALDNLTKRLKAAAIKYKFDKCC